MITKPTLEFPPWADTGDRIMPDISYIASGFPHSPDKPTRQTMNWVLNYTTNGVEYMVSRGLPDWDGAQVYNAGDVVRFAGKFYSAINGNTNQQPASNPTAWALWYVFPADLNQLYITPAQVAQTYLTQANAIATYETIANVNGVRANLQGQINNIIASSHPQLLPGSGIAIDSITNIISNTAPNVNADWNASTGPSAINNKPVLAAVATSGDYHDLVGQPQLATVATSGQYNDLVGLPSIPAAQVNADWLAESGPAEILNKPSLPDIFVASGDVVTEGDHLRVVRLQTVPLDFSVGGPTDGQILQFSSARSAYVAASLANLLPITVSGGNLYFDAPQFNFRNAGWSTLRIDCSTGIPTIIPAGGTQQVNFTGTLAASAAIVSSGPVTAATQLICTPHYLGNAGGLWIGATGTGTGYLQFNNNGQWGQSHPWIYSSTGAIEFRNTALSIYGDVQAVGSRFVNWTPNMAAYNQLSHPNGDHPHFVSTTGAHIFDGQVHVRNQGGLFVLDPASLGRYINLNMNSSYAAITSTTGQVYFQNVNVFVTTPGAGAAGGFRVYSNDMTKYLQIWSNNGMDDIFYLQPARADGSGAAPGMFLMIDNAYLHTRGDAMKSGISGGYQAGHYWNSTWNGSTIQGWVNDTAPGMVCDVRVKQDIEPIRDGALAIINQLHAVTYRIKDIPDDIFHDDGRQHLGFLANELGALEPCLVDKECDCLTDSGKIQPQNLNPLDYLALLTKAVQELSAKVERFESLFPEFN